LRRSTLAAATVLALLAGYIYWFEREPVSDTEGEKVFGVEEDSINRIEIRRSSDEVPVVLEREGEEGFRLVSPVAADADEGEVDLLLQNLATMRFERVVAKASSVSLSDFGLEAPRIEVRFRTGDGAERSIAFGSDTPTPSNQYARRDGGEDVIVVASHLSLNFDKSGWDLRDKAVFALETSQEANRIEIERPEGKLILLNEGGLWFLAEPRSRADRNRAAGIASRVRGAEMKEIVSESPSNLESYGLDAPTRRVRIEFGGESRSSLELEIGVSRDSDYYARTPTRAQVFVVASDLVSELDTDVSEIQSKKLFDFSTLAAKRLRIEAKGSAPRELERQDSTEEKNWRQSSPEPARDLDTTTVEDLLYALNGASGTLAAAPAMGEPDLTITAWSGDPLIEETVEVRKRGEGVEVTRAGESVALELPQDVWKDIDAKLKLEPEDKQ
jgi:Domain of unknown function (DUF4340)